MITARSENSLEVRLATGASVKALTVLFLVLGVVGAPLCLAAQRHPPHTVVHCARAQGECRFDRYALSGRLGSTAVPVSQLRGADVRSDGRGTRLIVLRQSPAGDLGVGHPLRDDALVAAYRTAAARIDAFARDPGAPDLALEFVDTAQPAWLVWALALFPFAAAALFRLAWRSATLSFDRARGTLEYRPGRGPARSVPLAEIARIRAVRITTAGRVGIEALEIVGTDGRARVSFRVQRTAGVQVQVERDAEAIGAFLGVPCELGRAAS